MKRKLDERRRRRWDALIETEGKALGLGNCRPFLENKLVNDIFYEGLLVGRPCIVKCSSRAPESIENEYALSSRLHASGPGWNAYAAGKWMGKVEGNRSLADDPDDRYADEVLAILDSLYEAKVVHRDILPSNFLIAPDGHLKLIDLQFAVDMEAKRIDPWMKRHPQYHFGVFAAVVTRDGAWWDDAAFACMLLPSLRTGARSRIGRLRFEVPFSPAVRIRLRLYVLMMRMQRMFCPKDSRRRKALDRRLERFKW